MDKANQYHGKNKYFGNTAEHYDDKRRNKSRWQREQIIIRDFVNEIPRGSSVLDVPFGTGRFVPFYLERKLIIFGVDISSDMIDQARKNIGENWSYCDVRVGDAESLPFSNNSIDYIVSTRFIKWLPTLDVVENVISEFARVAKEKIIVQAKLPLSELEHGTSTKMFKKLSRSIKQLLPGRKSKKEEVTRRWSDSDLREIFGRQQLQVLRTLDGDNVGRGLRYYILQKKAS